MRGRAPITLLACVCAAALTGCGSGSEQRTIPSEDGEQLISLLDGIEQNVDLGACDSASVQADEFTETVNLLPAEAGTEVKEALREAGARLQTLTAEDCEDATGTTGAGGAQPTEAEPTDPTTTTETTTTEETTTAEETEPAPSDEGDEDGSDGEGSPAEPPPEPPSGGGEGPSSGGIGSDEKRSRR